MQWGKCMAVVAVYCPQLSNRTCMKKTVRCPCHYHLKQLWYDSGGSIIWLIIIVVVLLEERVYYHYNKNEPMAVYPMSAVARNTNSNSLVPQENSRLAPIFPIDINIYCICYDIASCTTMHAISTGSPHPLWHVIQTVLHSLFQIKIEIIFLLLYTYVQNLLFKWE